MCLVTTFQRKTLHNKIYIFKFFISKGIACLIIPKTFKMFMITVKHRKRPSQIRSIVQTIYSYEICLLPSPFSDGETKNYYFEVVEEQLLFCCTMQQKSSWEIAQNLWRKSNGKWQLRVYHSWWLLLNTVNHKFTFTLIHVWGGLFIDTHHWHITSLLVSLIKCPLECHRYVTF